eukprot:TRINITY_DN11318_c0_g1_i1.p1 TRINITY_DN11318_c0_g1~~TRINITY_DN11318_c0_g1_i1.p1  ORF type:complete len:820 (-),score=224.89 TRINITY_DN11318_c0_g1_i1:146-2605(-)
MSVRIIRKGGIWKNTEDEILKAAVMKYGKNQWARIASLLSRKTAKQCKARWYEWLDPSIKKTEWSREEEEKLLHMAKIMPMQWASIAPIVGRTAAQCLEHYEKLVDAATGRDELDPLDDPRRLRPGEIDPNPESKPALPDKQDMEEIEKEMLQEARARLANTKGKKAKRKAREKQLEEARRLAALQKRRELKAAGIGGGGSGARHKKKRKGIDYMAEIPFQIKPAPGFHSVAEELAREREVRKLPNFRPVLLQQLEGERRDEAEQKARKQDIEKARDKLEKDPASVLNLNQVKDVRRSKLNLPNPQMTDQEIRELSKLGYQPDESEGGNEATRDLLSNYVPTPTPRTSGASGPETPIVDRTPARPNTLITEAQNLRNLTEASTPLAGGENPHLHPSDFSGATPKRPDLRTPNPLATPFRDGPVGTTPGMTPTPRTPGTTVNNGKLLRFRDQMNINESGGERAIVPSGDDFLAEEEQAAAVAHKVRDAKKNLLKGLEALPRPREYQVQLPDLEELEILEDGSENTSGNFRKGTASFLMDSEDVQRKRKLEMEEILELELSRRSSALKRGLPRPFRVNAAYAKSTKEIEEMPGKTLRALEDVAMELVKAEMVSLLTYDALKYPTKEVKPPSKVIPEIFMQSFEVFEPSVLQDAKKLINDEMDALIKTFGTYPLSEFHSTWIECHSDLIYLPNVNKFGLCSNLKSEDAKSKAFQQMYENIVEDVKKLNKRAMALEKKVKLYNQGYVKVAETKEQEIYRLQKQIDESKMELQCFKAMKELEDLGIPHRLKTAQEQVNIQREIEKQLQDRYGSLIKEKQSLCSS